MGDVFVKNIKKKVLAVVLLLGTVVIAGYGNQGKSGFEENEIAKINGLPICEEEFRLVLEENHLQYERELTEEFQIPPDIEAEQYFSGEGEYWKKMSDKNIEKLCRIKVQQKLAQDRGLTEVFEWETFLKQLERENSLREEKVNNGEVIYGLTNFGKKEFYTYQVDAMVNKLKNDILQEKGRDITKKEAEKYYQQLEFPVSREGERYIYTMCEVTELMDGKNKDATKILSVLAEKLKEGGWQDQKQLEVEDISFRSETRELNQDELRELVRSDLDGEAILALSQGQVSDVLLLEGKRWLVHYEGLKKAESLSETDLEAVKRMMQEEEYEDYIDRQAEKAIIEIHEEGLKDFIADIKKSP